MAGTHNALPRSRSKDAFSARRGGDNGPSGHAAERDFETLYDTPSDLFRILLGAAVCFFVCIQIFRYSRDPADMRRWVPIGLAIVPLALICARVIW